MWVNLSEIDHVIKHLAEVTGCLQPLAQTDIYMKFLSRGKELERF